MHKFTLVSILGLLLPITACSDDGSGGEDSNSSLSGASVSASGGTSAGTADATSDGSDCTPGYESCECVGGEVCLAGLTCVSKVCVNLGELTSGGGAGDSTGKEPDDTPPPTGDCNESDDCLDNEVCVDGYCGDTDYYYFDVRVTHFAPNDCSDGWGAGEVYFAYFSDADTLQAVSPWSYCPASWADLEVPHYDSLQSFRLDFWEDDAFDDDYMATLCWDANGNTTTFDNCSVVPKIWLHAGLVNGYIGANNQYGITVTFTPIPWS